MDRQDDDLTFWSRAQVFVQLLASLPSLLDKTYMASYLASYWATKPADDIQSFFVFVELSNNTVKLSAWRAHAPPAVRPCPLRLLCEDASDHCALVAIPCWLFTPARPPRIPPSNVIMFRSSLWININQKCYIFPTMQYVSCIIIKEFLQELSAYTIFSKLVF